jgi:hypothetical protein
MAVVEVQINRQIHPVVTLVNIRVVVVVVVHITEVTITGVTVVRVLL